MEWHHPAQQKRLWTSLLNYAVARPSTLRQIPEDATLLLIPEGDIVDEHEGLRSTLYNNPMATRDRLAFVRLSMQKPYNPYILDVPQVTGVRVEYLDRAEEHPLYVLNGMAMS